LKEETRKETDVRKKETEIIKKMTEYKRSQEKEFGPRKAK
jgi:hypothetical protein